MSNKIIRSVCIFLDDLEYNYTEKLNKVCSKLKNSDFEIQTRRLCTNISSIKSLEENVEKSISYISIGKKNYPQTMTQLHNFFEAKRISFCLDLTNKKITKDHVSILFEIIKNKPKHTFNFSYSFNTPNSSPFFNCTNYKQNGYSIGLQLTDLSEKSENIEEWFSEIQRTWNEIMDLFGDDKEFLGIDGSIAPLFEGKSSLIDFIKKLGYSFATSTTTDIYTRITKFIHKKNPKPIGMNGLMFPALEDFELANEYSGGNFDIERNIFLSLHSGLGIDTYPIGIDENIERVTEILQLIQALSTKYSKHFAVRFVSDGKSKINERSDFDNQYLKDVVIRKL